MQADFNKNHFELFGIEPGFEVDREQLAVNYRELQRVTHPDRFANASDHERRLSVQHTAHINEAYRVLKNPLSRARYLLELNGIVWDESDTAMDPAFLMEQMELREALAAVNGAADRFAALDQVRGQIEQREDGFIKRLQELFADGSATALGEARDVARKLQFMQRLGGEVSQLEEDLVDAV